MSKKNRKVVELKPVEIPGPEENGMSVQAQVAELALELGEMVQERFFARGECRNMAVLANALARAGASVMVEHCSTVDLPKAAQGLVYQISYVLNEIGPPPPGKGAVVEGESLVPGQVEGEVA